MNRFIRHAAALALVLLAGSIHSPALAHEPNPDSLRERWQNHYSAKRYAEAEKLLEQLVAAPAATPIDWYNLACVRCKLGEREDAWTALRRAIEMGFVDFAQVQRDPDLACAREHPDFQRRPCRA